MRIIVNGLVNDLSLVCEEAQRRPTFMICAYLQRIQITYINYVIINNNYKDSHFVEI